MNNFVRWSDAFKDETLERVDLSPDELCTFGIKPLDDSLKFIRKNDLITIGAKTGQGKSELGIHIAQHNAQRGQKVALYYLEGGYKEAIQRMKWKDICRLYYSKHTKSCINMDYTDWCSNSNTSDVLRAIENEVWEEYKEKYKDNLYLYNSTSGLTLDDFLASLLDFHSLETACGETFDPTRKIGFDLDLIVIDHLQYFSLVDSETELMQITNILRAVKNITDNYHIPVVLISHVRKMGKDSGLPDVEDFHGSSNIGKISSTCIMLSPATDKDNLAENIYPTYMRIVKSRMGIRPTYAVLVNFDLTRREYSRYYDMYRVNYYGEVAETPLIQTEMPKWAR